MKKDVQKIAVLNIVQKNIEWMENDMPLSLVKSYHDRTEGQLSLANAIDVITDAEYKELSEKLSDVSNLRIYGFNSKTLEEEQTNGN